MASSVAPSSRRATTTVPGSLTTVGSAVQAARSTTRQSARTSEITSPAAVAAELTQFRSSSSETSTRTAVTLSSVLRSLRPRLGRYPSNNDELRSPFLDGDSFGDSSAANTDVDSRTVGFSESPGPIHPVYSADRGTASRSILQNRSRSALNSI